MSQRSRGERPRPPPRNSSAQGEEVHLWQKIQDDIAAIIEEVNQSNDNVRQIAAQESYANTNQDSKDDVDRNSVTQALQQLDKLYRDGVKINDATTKKIADVLSFLEILKGIQEAKEKAAAPAIGSSSRSASLLSGAGRNLYDFDGAADSPHPSPIGGHARKLGGRGGGGAESVEPQGHSFSSATAGSSIRAKVIFSKDQDVAFKPKPPTPNDTSEWYLGKVKQVLGEGKGRRYIVKDEDPDVPSPARKEYKMSASGMIPIPPPTTELPKLEKGKTVLALYPDSTTFYKAEVTGMDTGTGNVNLRFEGEEQSGTQQVVERRFVVDYRD
ncbi:SAGA-associated factor 29 [Cytospora mali]|uniref:SAGA-associated factor 29 n=1 Tax=Cytospora mali TaxID=578113 RepID=A0A194VH20_CYTMA|nr:SAGA-associated factor 29 [Valsa mali var. pyri (nom. inval.)]